MPSTPSNLPKSLPKASKVLGDTTTIFKDWAQHVPIQTWILLGLGTLLIIIAGILIGGLYVLFQFSKLIQAIWLFIGMLTFLLTFIFLLAILGMIGIYAVRLIVLKRYSPWSAWKKGLKLAKQNFFKTFVMGICNTVVGCSVGCLSLIILLVLLGIPAIIITVQLFKNGNFRWPSWPQGIALIVLLLLFTYLFLLIRALLVVFNHGTWNLFFKEVTKGEKL